MSSLYQDGIRDQKVDALAGKVDCVSRSLTETISDIEADVDGLKRAMWVLYGAISISIFVIPLAWAWALK